MQYPKWLHFSSLIKKTWVVMILTGWLCLSVLFCGPAYSLVTPDTMPRATSFVTAAVERVGMAVVRIDTERTVSSNVDPLFEDPFFRRFFGDQVPQRQPKQLLRGEGSGVIIDANGIVLTNAHVVNNASKVSVRLKDGRTFTGTVLGVDEVTDLAVVKINANALPVASLGDSNQVSVGDWAIAVGNPLGLDNTVTLGIISTLKRSSAAVGIPDKRLDFIQTDAAINPGNSGGPLLNAAGEVIGINTAIRPDAMGIGFAIPINKAKEVSGLLIGGKTVPHPFIGIQMITLTPEIARENNQSQRAEFTIPEINGVLVTGIVPDSPAQKAGLQPGDTVTGIDNSDITTAEQLQATVEASGVGKKLNLKIQRDGKNISVPVVTGQLK